jgi:hypothetical protein
VLACVGMRWCVVVCVGAYWCVLVCVVLFWCVLLVCWLCVGACCLSVGCVLVCWRALGMCSCRGVIINHVHHRSHPSLITPIIDHIQLWRTSIIDRETSITSVVGQSHPPHRDRSPVNTPVTNLITVPEKVEPANVSND